MADNWVGADNNTTEVTIDILLIIGSAQTWGFESPAAPSEGLQIAPAQYWRG